MVFFVCDGCNETLKKNQVDKHAQRCRVCAAVTCVDCSVSFYGNDYAAHTTCISEAEKYEGSLYKAKPKAKMNPQEAWNLVVEVSCTVRAKEAPSSVAALLPRLAELSNVPRQKKKFVNFVKNSLRLYSDKAIEDLWLHLESGKEADKAKDGNDGDKENDTSSEDDKKECETAGDDAGVESKKRGRDDLEGDVSLSEEERKKERKREKKEHKREKKERKREKKERKERGSGGVQSD